VRAGNQDGYQALLHPLAYQPLAYQPLAYQPLAYQPLAYQPLAYQPLAYSCIHLLLHQPTPASTYFYISLLLHQPTPTSASPSSPSSEQLINSCFSTFAATHL